MVKSLKNIYRTSTIGHKVLSPIKWLNDLFWIRIASEESYLKRVYRMAYDLKLNLNNPRTLQEKYLWLRLNDKTKLHTLCADKYLVRNYIKEQIGGEYLIPLLFHTSDPKQLTLENLPNIPFIIKTNHGCKGHIIVYDKAKLNYGELRKKFRKALKSNIYYKSREWQYKNIKPHIIVEELLQKNKEQVLDYKFHCYNNIVNMIEVYIYAKDGLKINFYKRDWEKLDIRSRDTESTVPTKRPKRLNTMIKLAQKLSTNFKFVKVDMYNIDGKIFIGELTFTPSMGLQGFIPDEWNLKLGDKLKL
ncbi:ATP-grasp fold amidoligase family protein [Candidatus Neomarinimicrobiota bacterium]